MRSGRVSGIVERLRRTQIRNRNRVFHYATIRRFPQIGTVFAAKSRCLHRPVPRMALAKKIEHFWCKHYFAFDLHHF
jgi:hypothetical protein